MQPAGVGDIYLSGGDSSYYDMYATWRGGPFDCPFVVPAHRGTWGQLKSLYR